MIPYSITQEFAQLNVDRLSKSFGGLKAVDDFSLRLQEREIVGLIGPNGAGKTTAFNLITGLERPDSGTVFFFAASTSRTGPHTRSPSRGLRARFRIHAC